MLLDDQGVPRLVQNIRAIPRPGNTALLVVHLFNGYSVTAQIDSDADTVTQTLRAHSEYVYEWWESVVSEWVFPTVRDEPKERAGQYH